MVRSVAARLQGTRAMPDAVARSVGRVSQLSRLGLFVLGAAVAASATGCVERDPFSASDVAAADAFHEAQAAAAMRGSAQPASAGGRVACRCDSEGGLHVEAPPGARVKVNESSEDAEAEITIPERAPGTPIRHTVSLGFAGDGKLSETPSRASSGGAPDGFGVQPGYAAYTYGYGRVGSGSATRGQSHTRTRGTSTSTSSGGSGGSRGGGLIFSPHVHSSAMGSGRTGAGSSGHAGGGSHGPR
jgi:hypothetical protein